MPRRLPSPCAHHGCSKLSTSRRCADHALETNARAYRGGSAKQGYGARHRKWRLMVCNRDRWTCQSCGAPGNVADHIIPKERGGWELENGQCLCVPCHGRKTAQEGRGGDL